MTGSQIVWHRRQVTQESFDRAVQAFGFEATSENFCVTPPVCEHIWKMDISEVALANGTAQYAAWNRCGLCGLAGQTVWLDGAR